MAYAIIETGGKQLRVEPGRFYDIELLHVEPEAPVTIDKVLLVQNNGDLSIGQPYVQGATVEGTVMRHLRGRKVIVYKMKPKKKTRKKRGHRQEITRLMINSINVNGSVLASEQNAASEAQLPPTPIVTETPPFTEQPVATPAVEEPTPVTETPAVEEQPTPIVATETLVTTETPVVNEPIVATIATPEAPAVTATPAQEQPISAIAAPETIAAAETPTSDEPDPQTVTPDATQAIVESAVAEEPDAESIAPDRTAENAAE